jgi:predicted phosphodiesterase
VAQLILVIADIHANLTALEAVLADVAAQGAVDEIWCLGDAVGYGPDPAACLRLLQAKYTVWVAGNHDFAAAGVIGTSDFSANAAAAMAWTQSQLSREDAVFLSRQPLRQERYGFTLVHGSPRNPVEEYIFYVDTAAVNFAVFSSLYCLVGHTHQPAAFGRDEHRVWEIGLDKPLALQKTRLILNPGAVGQPRDSDPRASYGIIDLSRREFHLHRVAYDITAVQQRMRRYDLPLPLIERLSVGR